MTQEVHVMDAISEIATISWDFYIGANAGSEFQARSLTWHFLGPTSMSEAEAYLGKGPIPRGKEWSARMLQDVLTVHARDITYADLDNSESAVFAMLDVIMHANDHQVRKRVRASG